MARGYLAPWCDENSLLRVSAHSATLGKRNNCRQESSIRPSRNDKRMGYAMQIGTNPNENAGPTLDSLGRTDLLPLNGGFLERGTPN